MPRGRKDGGTGRNGKEKPVVVMGRENGGSGQNAGDAQGEKTRRYGREWEGKTGGGYGTGKWRKWSERWGCLGGEDGGMGGTLKGLGKEDSG